MSDSGLRRWRPSRIGLRLLAFNILVVFAPALGVLYLDAYESHLRQAQENAMAQQARIVAAAIAEDSAGGALDAPRFERTLARLERRTDARFRVYDVTGALVADSARAAGPASVESAKYGPEAADTRSRPLYRASARLVNAVKVAKEAVRGWLHGTPKVPQTPGTDPVQAELRTALAGHYGAAIRVTPGQRSLTMFSAVPVQRDGAVIAAVVASQSTYRILRALYDVRLRLIEIVMASLIVAAALTALAATTIVRPLARLQKQASTLAERRGPWTGTFPGAARKDELGDLARALGELARRTNDHMALLQSFSADVSHELKNPLASIRTAAEMMAGADSDRERERFLQLMIRDVARLERLVSSLRDVAIVERQIEHDAMTPVDLDGVLREIVDAARRSAGAQVSIELSTAAACAVRASRERLAQVFDNLIANAVSFAPDGTSVTVRSSADASRAVVIVEDSGPGIPESHMDRIFARFFTYRPVQGRGEHVGLGLAIASQIVQSYGGDIVAANREEGGARFVVRLPRAGV